MATGPQLPVHKVIMVGTGGVGKSALTLRFMYDEVSATTDCLVTARQSAHTLTKSSCSVNRHCDSITFLSLLRAYMRDCPCVCMMHSQFR